MQRTITAIVGLAAATWLTGVNAEAYVQSVRIGAKDVAALAKFYDKTLGMKEVLRYGQPGEPRWEIITRYGATVAAAKANASPELVIELLDPGMTNSSMAHTILRVSDIDASVKAVKAAGATMKDEIFSATITGKPVKLAMFIDPEGNFIELMELPKGMSHLQPQP